MVHKFFLNGYFIILDVNSGAVHVVDECTYMLIDCIAPPMQAECPQEAFNSLSSSFPYKEILEAYGELYELYKDGLLFSQDTYQVYADKLDSAPIKSMCLNIAHDCNMRCVYCFATQGDFGNGRKLMPFEVGKAAIDFLIKHSSGRKNLELDFFGGEPLMNFETMKQIVRYARGIEKENNKNFRFTVTTNGLLLTNEKIEFINREMSNVVLSIDGRPEINDALRRKEDGSGSYHSILPKYKRLVSLRNGKEYYVRGTYTKYNLDFTKDVMHLLDEGFSQISVEPAVTDNSRLYALTEQDIPQLLIEYETLAKEILIRNKRGEVFNFFHFMLDLDQGPCAIKRLRGCSCGNEYVAVTPEGDIYPCHQFVGVDKLKMGNVLYDNINNGIKESFANVNVYKKEKCKRCWAKFYCSGGCNANNFIYAGDILEPHKLSCEIEKKRLECAIMIKVALA